MGELQRPEHSDQPYEPQWTGEVYAELLVIARRVARRSRASHTLSPENLLSEAWIRVTGKQAVFCDRDHFFATIARTIYHILIDYERGRNADKRGGQYRRTEKEIEFREHWTTPLQVNAAIAKLRDLDPALAKLVDLRFSCGYSVKEVAAVTKHSERTIARQWALAKSLLAKELEDAR